MSSRLFLSTSDRMTHEDALTRRLSEALTRVRQGAASPSYDEAVFLRELAERDFSSPQALDEVLDWTVGYLEKGGVQMTHPRYFGLFNPAPSYPSECADRVMAAFNPQVCVLSHAPVAVYIERHVVEAMCRRVGFRRAAGHMTSGGSEANASAVVCALTRRSPDFATRGCRAFDGQPRLYVSRESHLAWLKIAHICGMGREAVRLIETDGRGQMSPDELSTVLAMDTAQGDVPIMVAATVGTTNAGMIDPVMACKRLADRYHMWLHVDAAWGGALIADETQRAALAGIEQADSITIDAHKWFATTMGTGMFLTPNTDSLDACFHAKASYMPSQDASVDYYLTSMQWSRRFSGLRLFMALATGGWSAFAAHIQRAQSLVQYANEQLLERAWRVVNDSPMAVSCVVPPKGTTTPCHTIVERVVEAGNAWISIAEFERTPVIRFCITNGTTTESDMDVLVNELIRATDSPH
ncbi:MAG: pyridoxal-dependent decarboxylase [Pseudomonadota bacterium]